MQLRISENGRMRKVLSLAFLLSLFTLESQASIPVALEFPRGKFQEDNPPTLFKWSLASPATTLTLKIFRINQDGSYEVEKNLVARFDFAASTETMTWPNAPLAQGKYVWALEVYDSKSSRPIAQESASFEIENLKHFDLRARRLALTVGFSRGKYRSQDPNYDLDFDITPTNYGLLVQAGDEGTLWAIDGQMSDYVLRGAVRRSGELSAYRLSRIMGASAFGVETFLGPSLRVMKTPRIRSLNGTDISEDQIVLVNPGLSLLVKRGVDLHTTIFSQVTFDLPVYSTDDAKVDFSNINYNIQAGFLYGLFWPIAIGGEIQYKLDKSVTKDGSDEIEISAADWSILGRIFYGF